MKVAIMQPYFLPYLGYWQLLNLVDTFVIYDDVNYINKGWINRNNMLLSSQIFQFNLLLSGASQNKKINEIEIQPDQKKLIKTIESAYKKAPNFDAVFQLFLKVMGNDNRCLATFLGESIKEIADYLTIQTEIINSSELKKDNSLKGEDKILDICKILGASDYINPIGGYELYSQEAFCKEGIRLNFLNCKTVSYKQFNIEPVPNLSIIDVLMFNEINAVKEMLEQFELL